MLKKDPNELTEYLQFRRRGNRVEAKKGRGYKYKRSQKTVETNKEIKESIKE